MIVMGLYREVAGGGLPHVATGAGTVALGSHANTGLIVFGAIYILARAFANGGSSLTGIEAVSNAVSALQPPEGRSAREILVAQGMHRRLPHRRDLLAGSRHARDALQGMESRPCWPRRPERSSGHPCRARSCSSPCRLVPLAILFTGGNTSFSGFPFLASFVAEDGFLPRWLSKRGHRLVFSNGILILAARLADAAAGRGGLRSSALIPFYAIGVFTGFSIAGLGHGPVPPAAQGTWMATLDWSSTPLGGVYTVLVVLVFAIVKFTEGAWLVVVIFPILVYALLKLHGEYRRESDVLDNLDGTDVHVTTGTSPQRSVILFVDRYDLATIAALRYARSLRPASLRAVHLTIDQAHAKRLADRWLSAGARHPASSWSTAPTGGWPTPPLISSLRRRRTKLGT